MSDENQEEKKEKEPYLNAYHQKRNKEAIEAVKKMQEQPWSREQCIEQFRRHFKEHHGYYPDDEKRSKYPNS